MAAVPAALRQKLGEEGTFALVEVVQDARRDWRDDVLAIAADRFERRLTDEVGRLRTEMAHLRSEMREEMVRMDSGLRQEISSTRTEILRWSFVFWIGQLAAMAGLLSFMMKAAVSH